MEDVSKSGESLASKLKTGLATAGRVAATGIGAITAAAGAAVGGLLALEQSTEEYRIAMGRLNTAFEAAGYGAETAQQAYNAFYGILGDTDTATEASQLLASLADSAEDVSVWTDIAAGVAGTFGDALPIESLIESANETARVGQVTGTLADALNWASISEDDFNAKLEACSSESERNRLIMETLAGQYDEASDAFYRNNEALVASRSAQAQMDAVLAKLGSTVSEVKNRLMGDFLPAISSVVSAFSDMISGADGADRAFSEALGGLVNQVVGQLPQFLSMGVQILTSLASGIIQSIPVVVAALPQVIQEILSALGDLLPQLLNMGGRLLEQLANGIETGLPNLVARLPVVIENILTYLTENMPAILEKGVEIINSLVNGIVEAIPNLVAALPDIITSFVGFISDNLPQIISAGFEILINLITGIINAIPELVASIPKIIQSIVDTFTANAQTFLGIGRAIIDGIKNGILAGVNAIKNAVTGVIDTVKGWFTGSDGFDTHSPSKWAKKVFQNVMQGGAEGLNAGLPGLLAEARSVTDQVQRGMNFGTANVDFASSGLGVSSAGIINGLSSSMQNGGGGTYTFNLVLPDGSKLASYTFRPLVDYARANGTPILNPT